MTNYFIHSLEKRVSKGEKYIPLEDVLAKIEDHIVKKIDPTFPIDDFRDWINSDSEKPFKHNRNHYYWSRDELK